MGEDERNCQETGDCSANPHPLSFILNWNGGTHQLLDHPSCSPDDNMLPCFPFCVKDNCPDQQFKTEKKAGHEIMKRCDSAAAHTSWW